MHGIQYVITNLIPIMVACLFSSFLLESLVVHIGFCLGPKVQMALLVLLDNKIGNPKFACFCKDV